MLRCLNFIRSFKPNSITKKFFQFLLKNALIKVFIACGGFSVFSPSNAVKLLGLVRGQTALITQGLNTRFRTLKVASRVAELLPKVMVVAYNS